MIHRRKPVAEAVPAEAEIRVDAVLARAHRFVEIAIPGTETRARMRLLTRGEEKALALEAASWLADLMVGSDRLEATGLMPVTSEVILRRIAVAVRQLDADLPLATKQQWEDNADDDQVAELWHRYEDLRAELDPMAFDLPADEAAAIEAAVKKKDATLLRGFGARQLRAWLLITGSPPADSPTPRSSGGPE